MCRLLKRSLGVLLLGQLTSGGDAPSWPPETSLSILDGANNLYVSVPFPTGWAGSLTKSAFRDGSPIALTGQAFGGGSIFLVYGGAYVFGSTYRVELVATNEFGRSAPLIGFYPDLTFAWANEAEIEFTDLGDGTMRVAWPDPIGGTAPVIFEVVTTKNTIVLTTESDPSGRELVYEGFERGATYEVTVTATDGSDQTAELFASYTPAIVECTSDEVSAIRAARILDQLVSIAIRLEDDVDGAESRLNGFLTLNELDSISCLPCFESLISFLFRLELSKRIACSNNLNGQECLGDVSDALIAFHDCTGFAFSVEETIAEISDSTSPSPRPEHMEAQTELTTTSSTTVTLEEGTTSSSTAASTSVTPAKSTKSIQGLAIYFAAFVLSL